MGDEVEAPAIRPEQGKAAPSCAQDEVGLTQAILPEAGQSRRRGEAALGDAHLAGDGGATFEGFAAAAVGDFEMREATAAEFEDAMHPPVGALAAVPADAGAIGQAQAAPGPVQTVAAGAADQQMRDDRGQEVHSFVEPVFQPRFAEAGEADHRRPTRRLSQRQPAGSARQCQTQQRSPAGQRTPPFDGAVLGGQPVQFQVGRQTAQKLSKLVIVR